MRAVGAATRCDQPAPSTRATTRVRSSGPLPSAAARTITPEISWPGRHPSGRLDSNANSPRFMENAWTSTMASSLAGSGSGTSRNSTGIGADGVFTRASMISLLFVSKVLLHPRICTRPGRSSFDSITSRTFLGVDMSAAAIYTFYQGSFTFTTGLRSFGVTVDASPKERSANRTVRSGSSTSRRSRVVSARSSGLALHTAGSSALSDDVAHPPHRNAILLEATSVVATRPTKPNGKSV